MGITEDIKTLIRSEGKKGTTTRNVLARAKTRFGLLVVRDDGACFPEKGVHFSNQELDLVMGKGLSRQRIDAIFKLKEKFEGEVVGCEGISH